MAMHHVNWTSSDRISFLLLESESFWVQEATIFRVFVSKGDLSKTSNLGHLHIISAGFNALYLGKEERFFDLVFNKHLPFLFLIS